MKQTLKYIYNILYEQLKYAETKYSISITLASALTVFSATYLKNFPPLITALSAISIIFSLISVGYGFLAISSKRLSQKKYVKIDKKLNLVYHKDIGKLNVKNYIEELIKNYPFLKGYQADNFDYDLARQVIDTAKNITQKYTFFNFSVVFLVASLITESIAIFLLGVGGSI